MEVTQIPDFTMEATFRELLEPAMEIAKARDMELAREYRERYLAHLMRDAKRTYEEALKIFHSNLGYYAGYYDTATQKAVQEVFGSVHPIFGGI